MTALPSVAGIVLLVVGSNLLSLALVLGLTAIVAPGGITAPADAQRFDKPVMFGAAFLCVPVFLRDRRDSRGRLWRARTWAGSRRSSSSSPCQPSPWASSSGPREHCGGDTSRDRPARPGRSPSPRSFKA